MSHGDAGGGVLATSRGGGTDTARGELHVRSAAVIGIVGGGNGGKEGVGEKQGSGTKKRG